MATTFPIDHPLLAPFRRCAGVRTAENTSATLDDFTFTIRVDDDGTIELREERTSYWDSAVVAVHTLRGRAEVLRDTPEKLALKLVGTDDKGASVEEALVLTEVDIVRGTVDWALRTHS